MSTTDELNKGNDHTVLAVLRSQLSDLKADNAGLSAKVDAMIARFDHFADSIGQRIQESEAKLIRHDGRILATREAFGTFQAMIERNQIDSADKSRDSRERMQTQLDRISLKVDDIDKRLIAIDPIIRDFDLIKRTAITNILGLIILGSLMAYFALVK